MFEVNDVVRFKDNNIPVEILGVITRVESKDYVQILAENGKTYSAAYVGYLKPTEYKMPISNLLDEFARIKRLEDHNAR